MARQLLCYGKNCYEDKIKHDKEELTKYKGKNYCPQCLKIKKQYDESRHYLYNILTRIYGEKRIPGMVLAQVKRFVKGGMTHQGIANTIRYLELERGYTFEMQYGIGLVGSYYDNGQYFKEENITPKPTNKNIVVRTTIKHLTYGFPIKPINEGDLFND